MVQLTRSDRGRAATTPRDTQASKSTGIIRQPEPGRLLNTVYLDPMWWVNNWQCKYRKQNGGSGTINKYSNLAHIIS